MEKPIGRMVLERNVRGKWRVGGINKPSRKGTDVPAKQEFRRRVKCKSRYHILDAH